MNRPLQRLLKVATFVALTAVLLVLRPIAGHATVDPTHPTPPPPPREVTIVPDLIAWELRYPGCLPPRIVISLADPANAPVSVILSTADRTAHAPDDYVAITGLKVTIPAGQLSVAVPVRIQPDTVKEQDEYFTAKISAPTGETLDTAVITIKDGEQPPGC